MRRSWKRDEEGVSGIVSGIIEDDFQNLPSKFALFTILYMELYTKSSLAEFNTQ